MTKETIKNAVIAAFWNFEKSGYTQEEFANHMVFLLWENVVEISEENRTLKDNLATLSKTKATDMQRLSDMIDKRQEALRYISEIIEEKALQREDLELGSTAYKSIRRWARLFANSKDD